MNFDRENVRKSIIARIPQLMTLDFDNANEFIFLREFAKVLATPLRDQKLFHDMIEVVNCMCSSNDPEIANFAQVGIFEHLAEYPNSFDKIFPNLNVQAINLLHQTLKYIQPS